MATRQKKIKVVVDGQKVQISGNTAGLDVHVTVISSPAHVSQNTMDKPWTEHWWAQAAMGIAATIFAAGLIYWLGWN